MFVLSNLIDLLDETIDLYQAILVWSDPLKKVAINNSEEHAEISLVRLSSVSGKLKFRNRRITESSFLVVTL